MSARIAGLLILFALGPAVQADGPVPVLLELFTSEGCSSCPPTDRLLESFDKTQPIPGAHAVVLSEHVDYWDGDGWKDPFSSAEITSRQREFGLRFHLDSVYTPQLVVDGSTELVGSRATEIMTAVQKAALEHKAPINLTLRPRSNDRLPIHVNLETLRGGPAAVFVALAERSAESQVLRGENSGRALRHVAVVRSLVWLGVARSGSPFAKNLALPLTRGAGANGLRVVVFAQDERTGRVLAIAEQELP